MNVDAKAFAAAVKAVARTVAKLAANAGDIDAVTRASDRAYRLARYQLDSAAANAQVDAARAGISEAIETASAARIAALYAKAAEARQAAREAALTSPTAWMRR